MTSTNPADALRGRLPDLYFANASSAQMEHHQASLQRLPQERRLIEFLRPDGAFLTELTVCTYDDERPGLLAKLCGTLASLKVVVHTASAFTLREDTPVVLDTLQISESYLGHDRRLRPGKQKAIVETLEKVLDGQVVVTDILRGPHRHWPLKIHEVSVENEPSQGHLVINVRTGKSQLAVFRMAGALAALDLNIQAAQIHKGKGEVHGVFFVTGQAGASSGEQLRLALQTGALPSSLSRQS